jgi:hypothetical protein
MKATKRIRMLRVLAIAGSMSALAVPTAVAQSATEIPVRAENGPATTQLHRQPLQIPSSFHTEIQTPSPAPQQPFHLPSHFRPEVQTPSSPTVASTPGSVVHEIRTFTDEGSPTLAIVMAGIALAVALGGLGYAWLRLSRMQRSLSSRPLVS